MGKMKDVTVSVAVIYFGDGVPDPYNFNDAMAHVNSSSTEVHFDWSDLQDRGKPSHYVISTGSLALLEKDTDSIMQAITDALVITQGIHEEDITADGEVVVDDCGIHKVDADVSANEALFTLSEYPDTWIHAIWRS